MHHKSHGQPAPPPAVVVEVCVQTVPSAVAAERAGADRIELCSGLDQGGVTPSAGLLREVRRRVGIPVFLLVRPRAGDFTCRGAELDVMLQDIREARRAGADGVVIGALDSEGNVDRTGCARMVDEAGPLPVAFHRAFDEVRDRRAGLEDLIRLGISRVLTSGGAATAADGIPELAALVSQAGGRVSIMAGGAVRAASAGRIVVQTGVRELHLGPRLGPAGELDVQAVEAVLASLPR